MTDLTTVVSTYFFRGLTARACERSGKRSGAGRKPTWAERSVEQESRKWIWALSGDFSTHAVMLRLYALIAAQSVYHHNSTLTCYQFHETGSAAALMEEFKFKYLFSCFCTMQLIQLLRLQILFAILWKFRTLFLFKYIIGYVSCCCEQVALSAEVTLPPQFRKILSISNWKPSHFGTRFSLFPRRSKNYLVS